MDRLSRVRVAGPLAPYAVGFGEELARQGYSQWTVIAHVQLMGHVSRWLAAHRMDANGLTDSAVQQFLRDRRASGQVRRLTPRGLVPLLGYLRELGVVSEAKPVVADDPLRPLLSKLADFLIDERGLAKGTVVYYCRFAKRFLSTRLPHGGVDAVELRTLTAGDVSSFVLGECGRRSIGSVKNVVTALRALLRFLYLRGHISTPLVDAVPAAAGWRGGSIPQVLPAGEVVGLLEGCDRRTVAGRRDYAILILLARLGLRAGEVAALTVDDVDWRVGEIGVSGKGNRHERMPLPVDVGRALADYCRRGRPESGCRSLLLQSRAPYTALSSSAVSKTVERACDHAGLPRMGAHQLRHAAATAMRQAGAPLLEISQVLRHRHPATTAGYGGIDVGALTAVARPWPGDAR
jgi:integrase/recombinase XerD